MTQGTSLHEGLAETLTVLRLGLPLTLARTLRSTNCVVILSRPEGVGHVVDRRLHRPNLPAGRGYLPPSRRRGSGRFGVRAEGVGTRLAG